MVWRVGLGFRLPVAIRRVRRLRSPPASTQTSLEIFISWVLLMAAAAPMRTAVVAPSCGNELSDQIAGFWRRLCSNRTGVLHTSHACHTRGAWHAVHMKLQTTALAECPPCARASSEEPSALKAWQAGGSDRWDRAGRVFDAAFVAVLLWLTFPWRETRCLAATPFAAALFSLFFQIA